MISKLKGVIPDDIYTELDLILKNRQISASQLAHILGNCQHECQWRIYEENLNYKPDRLLAIFPTRVKTIEKATSLCKEGVKAIGDFLYGGRMGNSATEGYTFRGRGCLQLTGKTNYIAFDATVIDDITNSPDLVKTKYKLTSAFWFFDTNKIWSLALDVSDKSILAVRKKVNGGTIGLEDTSLKVKNFYKLLI